VGQAYTKVTLKNLDLNKNWK